MEVRFCHNCGKEIPENADVCLNCGVSVKRAKNNLGSDKVMLAVICFFFGAIGIHNFIMGETKKGITRIVASFCCGIGEIFALVDFIKILTDKYVIDPDKLI